MKKRGGKNAIPMIRYAEQGFRCQCQVCRGKLDTGVVDHMFCACCGHGYIDLRSGRADDKRMGCTKCGAVGQFLEKRPELPNPSPRTFKIRISRMVREYVEIESVATCSADAVDDALRRTADGEGFWHLTSSVSGKSVDAVDLVGEKVTG